MKINLEKYGWSSFFMNAKTGQAESLCFEHGRIISVHKSRYEVVTSDGIFSCEILGKIQFRKNPLEQPAVGDWVFLKKEHDTYVIYKVLPRLSLLKRQKKHDHFPKPIAANVDYAFIVQSANDDFNIKRLERILVHVYDAGITPIIVINKIDLATAGTLRKIEEELQKINSTLDIVFTSYLTGQGIQELTSFLVPKKTIIFIGSSGVGKSSLINIFLGEKKQKTKTVTTATGKGRHTTTARRLLLLDSGVLVIDTPGTREFGMHDEDLSLKESFALVEEFQKQCKFANCLHNTEPDCQIRYALEQGLLDADTYKRYCLLQDELSQSAKQMRQGEKQSSKKRSRQPLRSVRPGKYKR